ncbi:MAG: hypothetical protein ACR2GW_14210 [Pyrinomonadaceae bacterium]
MTGLTEAIKQAQSIERAERILSVILSILFILSNFFRGSIQQSKDRRTISKQIILRQPRPVRIKNNSSFQFFPASALEKLSAHHKSSER